MRGLERRLDRLRAAHRAAGPAPAAGRDWGRVSAEEFAEARALAARCRPAPGDPYGFGALADDELGRFAELARKADGAPASPSASVGG